MLGYGGNVKPKLNEIARFLRHHLPDQSMSLSLYRSLWVRLMPGTKNLNLKHWYLERTGLTTDAWNEFSPYLDPLCYRRRASGVKLSINDDPEWWDTYYVASVHEVVIGGDSGGATIAVDAAGVPHLIGIHWGAGFEDLLLDGDTFWPAGDTVPASGTRSVDWFRRREYSARKKILRVHVTKANPLHRGGTKVDWSGCEYELAPGW